LKFHFWWILDQTVASGMNCLPFGGQKANGLSKDRKTVMICLNSPWMAAELSSELWMRP
jgi:hypothetical protein